MQTTDGKHRSDNRHIQNIFLKVFTTQELKFKPINKWTKDLKKHFLYLYLSIYTYISTYMYEWTKG